MINAPLRFLITGLIPLLLASYGPCAQARLVGYDFAINASFVFPPGAGLTGGGGHLVVDDASIPLLGAGSAIAATFEGSAGFGGFGYSKGNTLTRIDFNGTTVETLPHTDAQVLFQDHVAVGILFTEFHSVIIDLPIFPPPAAGSALMFRGSTWEYQEARAGVGGGITFTTAIPEAGTGALLAGGLGLMSLVFCRRNGRQQSR
jgi:hypothetical protein